MGEVSKVEETFELAGGVNAARYQKPGNQPGNTGRQAGNIGLGWNEPAWSQFSPGHTSRAWRGLLNTSTELCPPNPKELLIATSISRLRAWLGV